jgi:hypothetical protein
MLVVPFHIGQKRDKQKFKFARTLKNRNYVRRNKAVEKQQCQTL